MPFATKEQLLRENKRLENLLAEKENEIKLLGERVEQLKSALYGRSSEKRNGVTEKQTLLFNEIEQYASSANEEQTPPTPKTKKRSRARRNDEEKRGRKPLPEYLPRKEIVHELTPEEIGSRVFIKYDTTEVLVTEPPKVYVERHLYAVYAYPAGKEPEDEPCVITTPRITRLFTKSIASAALVAYIMVAKFRDALPFYRQEKIFARYGVCISRQDMCNWGILATWKGRRIYKLMHEEVKIGSLIGSDETRSQVLNEPGRSNTSQSYIYVIRGGPPDKPVIIFKYRRTREANFLRRLLAGYKGILQTDGYAGYDAVARSLEIRHVGCMDHVRRKFDEAWKVSGKKSRDAEAALDLIGRLYKTEEKARDKKITLSELARERDTKSRRRLKYFKRWLDRKSFEVAPKSMLGKAIRYALDQWPRITPYLDDVTIPISNILVENAIRPFVIGRKNWLFSASPRGAKASAFLYSLIETADANGLEPYWYLRYLFEKLPHAKNDDDLRLLLPNRLDMDTIRVFFSSSFPKWMLERSVRPRKTWPPSDCGEWA